MQFFRADPIHPIRKRLWQFAGAIGLVMLVLLARETILRNVHAPHRLILGGDFLPVYAAGQLVREGRAAELYAMQPLADIEREIVATADLEPLPVYGPFLNPPFFAEFYVPFASLPYRNALTLWASLNVLLFAASVALICRMLPPGHGWATWGLAVLLLLLPLPLWEAVWYQQNTFLSLFLICIIVYIWRRPINHTHKYLPDPCGLLCGLLFYKPQLAVVIAVALIVTRGRRAAIGLCVTGSLLLLFTLIKMPGTIPAFVHALPPTIHWMRTALRYNWGHQSTPQSFRRLLLQGHAPGENALLPKSLAVLTAGAFAVALGRVAFGIHKRSDDPLPRDRVIAAAICSMPMLMPYYMDYDLMQLAVPATLFAAEWIRFPRSITRADKLLLASWAALFLELYANPGLAAYARLNLAVPLIGLTAGLSIARCFRQSVATATVDRYDAPPLAAAA